MEALSHRKMNSGQIQRFMITQPTTFKESITWYLLDYSKYLPIFKFLASSSCPSSVLTEIVTSPAFVFHSSQTRWKFILMSDSTVQAEPIFLTDSNNNNIFVQFYTRMYDEKGSLLKEHKVQQILSSSLEDEKISLEGTAHRKRMISILPSSFILSNTTTTRTFQIEIELLFLSSNSSIYSEDPFIHVFPEERTEYLLKQLALRHAEFTDVILQCNSPQDSTVLAHSLILKIVAPQLWDFLLSTVMTTTRASSSSSVTSSSTSLSRSSGTPLSEELKLPVIPILSSFSSPSSSLYRFKVEGHQKHWEYLISFLYKGTPGEHSLSEFKEWIVLLQMAQKWGLTYLKRHCAQIMASQVTLGSVLSILESAYENHCDVLINFCIRFIRNQDKGEEYFTNVWKQFGCHPEALLIAKKESHLT